MDESNTNRRMDLTLSQQNAKLLEAELEWLAKIIDTRLKLYLGQNADYPDVYDIKPPDLSTSQTIYSQILTHYRMNFSERLVLLLSLAPHIQPQLLDVFFVKNTNYDRGFTEFGGVKGQHHSGFIPTWETAAFLLSANDLEKRIDFLTVFSEDHFLSKYKILKRSPGQDDEPCLSEVLSLSKEYLNYFTIGTSPKPDYSIHFPAKQITTQLEWSDLVLDEHTLEEVAEIKNWIEFGDTLLNDWGMRTKIKPGFRTLFYGPPGTGKTLTATLLGKSAALDVYRIDLSMVVSKYIGETEKNLANIFDQAENKNWLLFFDEADALFGKRTKSNSSNDKHANHEISYLLQRIENFPGIIIMASNLKTDLDDAFSKHFQSMVCFPMPGVEQRKQLWKQAFSDKSMQEESLNLDEIAVKYELSGGAIINVVRYCSLKAIAGNNNSILLKDIIAGIRKEFGKEGKIV